MIDVTTCWLHGRVAFDGLSTHSPRLIDRLDGPWAAIARRSGSFMQSIPPSVTVPQVPKIQGGFTLTWADPHILTAATQVRFSGEQFDDDLNTAAYVLGAYAVWDASVSRAVTRGVNAFLSVENILDTEYDTARTPLRQIGWPRTVRVGARFTWQ